MSKNPENLQSPLIPQEKQFYEDVGKVQALTAEDPKAYQVVRELTEQAVEHDDPDAINLLEVIISVFRRFF